MPIQEITKTTYHVCETTFKTREEAEYFERYMKLSRKISDGGWWNFLDPKRQELDLFEEDLARAYWATFHGMADHCPPELLRLLLDYSIERQKKG